MYHISQHQISELRRESQDLCTPLTVAHVLGVFSYGLPRYNPPAGRWEQATGLPDHVTKASLLSQHP